MKNIFLTFLFIFVFTSFFFQDVVKASKNLQNNQLDIPQKTHKRKKIHKSYDLRLQERRESSNLVSKKLKLNKKHNVKKKHNDKS